jgi:hypothetical protein
MTTDATTAPAAPNLGARVEQYIKLRDVIKAKEKAQKEELKPFKETLEKLSVYLLAHINQLGADSLSSPAGTVYRSERKTASLADPEAFMTWVITQGQWDLLVRKASDKAVEDFLTEHGTLPPGVNFSRENTINVRRK